MVPNRGESEGSVYQLDTGRHAGKWRAAVVVGWTPEGKPERRTAMRATETAARKALRDILNERDRGRVARDPKRLRLSEWLDRWLEDREESGDLAVSTLEDYRSLIRTWIAPTIGDKRLSQVSEPQALKVQSAMKAAGRSASRRHHAHIVLHAALDSAVRARLLAYNPVQQVDAPTVRRTEIVVPTRAEVEAVFDTLATERWARYRARYEFALVHGVRQGEALGLEWGQVDLAAGRVQLVRQLRRVKGQHGCGPKSSGQGDGWPCGRGWAKHCPDGTPGHLALLPLKTDRSRRTILLTDDLADLARALHKLQRRERLQHGTAYQTWRTDDTGRVWRARQDDDGQVEPLKRGQRDLQLVFAQPTGRPLDVREDHEQWQAVLKAAGLDPSRLHNARHRAVVDMLDGGVPLNRISTLLGHSSEAFTMQQYGHLSDEAAAETQDLMTAQQRKRVTKKTVARRRRPS